MKNIQYFLFLFLIVVITVYANVDKKAELKKQDKIYTAEDFKEKVAAEISRKLNMVSGKNMAKLSQELLLKEEKLLDKEEEIKRRAEQLTINEKLFSQRIKELHKQQSRLLGCLEGNKKEKKRRLTHLVEVVANMRPAQAAKILAVQDPDISVEILSKINSKKASKIFNLMDQEISARLQKQFILMKK